jgi:hypothetical protein
MLDTHTVWNRLAGTIEFNSSRMPFGIGFLNQTNKLKQETLYFYGNGCKGKSDKALQLELYKMHGANHEIKDSVNSTDEMKTCEELNGCGHIPLHERKQAPERASTLLERGNLGA